MEMKRCVKCDDLSKTFIDEGFSMRNVRTPMIGDAMKVGICGKMASGKTTLAKGFEEEGYQIISLADEVMSEGITNMTGKDRPLYNKSV